MKKILNLLGTITLIGTRTTSLVACCDKPYNNGSDKNNEPKTKSNHKDCQAQQLQIVGNC
ncbi:MAG: lipoprotein [Spiroplasma phoeniceum]|nr:MAG: lipoprotein [Spiroplasma phoeniceum]UZQ31495.1 MAG: lipoprotein [Spiroplasma phoeniceum]